MAINNIIDLMAEMKSHIAGDTILSYVENISIRKFRAGNLPKFETYAIILSPVSRKKEWIANRTKRIIWNVDVVCVVKNFHPENSLVGVQPVGLIRFVDNVETCLFNFCETKKDELDIFFDETDEEVNFDASDLPNLEDFFLHSVINFGVGSEHQTF